MIHLVVTAYEQIWGIAEDYFGLITSKKAAELGISRQCVRSLADSGKLIRLGFGLYQVHHHVPNRLDAYAAAHLLVGEEGYVRGASVVALLELCPTNPSLMYIGSSSRVRRRLPRGYLLKDMYKVPIEYYERIRCQRLPEALREARQEGSIERDRIAEAALVAKDKGLLTDEECAEFQG